MTSVVRITSVGDSDPHAIVDHQISNLAPDLNPFIHPPLAQNSCAHSGEVADVFFLVKNINRVCLSTSNIAYSHPAQRIPINEPQRTQRKLRSRNERMKCKGAIGCIFTTNSVGLVNI